MKWILESAMCIGDVFLDCSTPFYTLMLTNCARPLQAMGSSEKLLPATHYWHEHNSSDWIITINKIPKCFSAVDWFSWNIAVNHLNKQYRKPRDRNNWALCHLNWDKHHCLCNSFSFLSILHTCLSFLPLFLASPLWPPVLLGGSLCAAGGDDWLPAVILFSSLYCFAEFLTWSSG